MLEPERAAEVGLVHRVVDPAVLLDEACAAAARYARRAPGTIAALKRAVYEGGARPLADGLHTERAEFLAVASAPAALAAMRSYLAEQEADGRPPFADPESAAPWQDGTAAP